jgi:hypothetical protein
MFLAIPFPDDPQARGLLVLTVDLVIACVIVFCGSSISGRAGVERNATIYGMTPAVLFRRDACRRGSHSLRR